MTLQISYQNYLSPASQMPYPSSHIVQHHITFPTFSVLSELASWHVKHFIASYLI